MSDYVTYGLLLGSVAVGSALGTALFTPSKRTQTAREKMTLTRAEIEANFQTFGNRLYHIDDIVACAPTKDSSLTCIVRESDGCEIARNMYFQGEDQKRQNWIRKFIEKKANRQKVMNE
jgi:hypothetical protein